MSVALGGAVRGEWYRLKRRRSTWIALGLVTLAGAAFALAPKIADRAASVAQQLGGGASGEAPTNAYFYFSAGAKVVALLAGFFAASAAATGLAGEAAQGTLRWTLARPVSRGSVFASKWIVFAAYLHAMLFFGLVAAAAGAAIAGDFGAVAKFGLVKSTAGEMAARCATAIALADVSLLGVLSLSLLASVFSAGAGAAMTVTMGFLLFTSAASFVVESIRPYFFSSFALSAFDTLSAFARGIDAPRPVWFGNPTLQDWADVTFAFMLPTSSAMLLLLAAAIRFIKRDWLT